MTMKECDEEAQKHSKVICDGIEYKRILELGYYYGDNGSKTARVSLLDKNGHSVTYANPSEVKIVETGGEVQTDARN